MSGDNRASCSSMQRTASVSRTGLQSGSSFAEPPVALPNLDELRAADVLVRAYNDTLVKTPLPSKPPSCSFLLGPRSPAKDVEAPGHASRSAAPLVSTASRVVAAAEAKTVGEVVAAAVARDVVEAAARLYTTRRLDDLVETYVACATWDDAYDVVTSAFLTQDMQGDGLQREGAAQKSEAPSSTKDSSQDRQGNTPAPLPTPVFMRSALSLAGVATRTPTCTLTPQSSLTPPPFGTSMAVRRTSRDTAGPTPPASVPMDAFSRYVTVVEEAPTPVAAECPSSLLRAPPAPRQHSTKRKAKNTAQSTATAAAAAGVAAKLSASPPVAASASVKRGARGPQKRLQRPSQTPSQPETAPGRGKTILSPTAQPPPPPEDPLTRALRQGILATTGDDAASAAKAERPPARPAAGAGLSSLSFPSVVGGNDGAKKAACRQSPRGGGVIVVEQDRLVNIERGGRVAVRGGPRSDGVRCRVAPSEDGEAARLTEGDAATATAAISGTEVETANTNKFVGRGTQNGATESATAAATPAAAKAKKAAVAEREAWTASFFTATDAAGEASLLDQVQVRPSPGVTVIGGAPSQTATQTARRGHKGAAAGASAVAYGGDFAVPADRLALSTFEEKRVAARKLNTPGPMTSPGKPRPVAQAFKTT